MLDSETLEQEQVNRAKQRSAIVGFLRSEGYLATDADDLRSILHAIWRWMAPSPSDVLLVNIEDLWLETEPQNTPNTYTERPNWRRKLRHTFEQISDDPDLLAILREIGKLRVTARA